MCLVKIVRKTGGARAEQHWSYHQEEAVSLLQDLLIIKQLSGKGWRELRAGTARGTATTRPRCLPCEGGVTRRRSSQN